MIQGIGVCYIRDNIKMKSYLNKTGGYQPPAFLNITPPFASAYLPRLTYFQ